MRLFYSSFYKYFELVVGVFLLIGVDGNAGCHKRITLDNQGVVLVTLLGSKRHSA